MSVISQEKGIEHGTPAGYKRHIRRNEEPCEPCAKAKRDYNAEKQRQRRAELAAREAQLRRDHIERQRHQLGAPGDPVYRDGTLPGEDLVLGDVIVHLGRHYRIDKFTPYTGSLKSQLGAEARIAWSGTWSMAIGPRAAIPVLPRTQTGEPR
ncbi:hypothetical protein [Sphaerisporangium sp. NPDC051011]|uniref:hypothetical protein n=1 Tax=Sphaerisporangium sp. NPDC051011 TaxID=3155792 RepID=UPI00340139F0